MLHANPTAKQRRGRRAVAQDTNGALLRRGQHQPRRPGTRNFPFERGCRGWIERHALQRDHIALEPPRFGAETRPRATTRPCCAAAGWVGGNRRRRLTRAAVPRHPQLRPAPDGRGSKHQWRSTGSRCRRWGASWPSSTVTTAPGIVPLRDRRLDARLAVRRPRRGLFVHVRGGHGLLPGTAPRSSPPSTRRTCRALLYAGRAVRRPFEWPAGPETLSVAAQPASGRRRSRSATAAADDSRLTQSNRDRARAERRGGRGLPRHAPWAPALLALPMAASDGLS